MNLHRLNDAGTQQFWEYLPALRKYPLTVPPSELLDDPRFSELVEPIVAVAELNNPTKYEAGCQLATTLAPIPRSQLRMDVGIWSWMAYRYFDVLCPADGRGLRKPKENSKYIARPGDHRYGLDKHLLFFPWKMYCLHGGKARWLLSDAIGADSRVQREWTGYHLNVSTPLVELASRLYATDDRRSLKRGATGKRPGSLRRFVQVVRQLEVTYDIHGMSADQLQELLPAREFERWIGESK